MLYDALRAEYMAVSMYFQEGTENYMRQLLIDAKSAKKISEDILGQICKEETRLKSNIRKSINNFANRQVAFPIRARITLDNYGDILDKVVCSIIGNNQPVLRAVVADMMLRALELSWGRDLGWANAKGLLFLRRTPSPAYRIVGLQVPILMGRSDQKIKDDQILLEGLREMEGRYVWMYFQAHGEKLIQCGKEFRPYSPIEGFCPPLRS